GGGKIYNSSFDAEPKDQTTEHQCAAARANGRRFVWHFVRQVRLQFALATFKGIDDFFPSSNRYKRHDFHGRGGFCSSSQRAGLTCCPECWVARANSCLSLDSTGWSDAANDGSSNIQRSCSAKRVRHRSEGEARFVSAAVLLPLRPEHRSPEPA